MILLVLGVLLWSGAHLFKRLAPEQRAAMGDKGRGPIAILLFVSVGLMIVGYRLWWADLAYASPAWGKHANNTLMLVSMYLFAASGMKTAIARKMRHPMLIGVILWSVAHLLANGDWASVVLFGGMLIWAVVSIALINAQNPVWEKPAPAPKGKEFGAAFGSLLVYGVIAYIHILLGYMPFG